MNTHSLPLPTNGLIPQTRLVSTLPWGIYAKSGSRALCSDGKVRALSYIAQTADTFFSIPASVRVKGKTVFGYVTTTEQIWIKGEKETGFLSAVQFRQMTGGKRCKNAHLLPPWVEDTYHDEESARKLNSMIQATWKPATVPSGETGPFAIPEI